MDFRGVLQDWPVMLPQLLIYTAGIIVALANWNVSRTSAMLTLATMVLLIFVVVVQTPLNAYLRELARFNGWRTPHYIHLRLGLLLGVGSLRALGTILTLFAIFQARRPPPLP